MNGLGIALLVVAFCGAIWGAEETKPTAAPATKDETVEPKKTKTKRKIESAIVTDVLKYGTECQEKENINIHDCLEMLEPGADLSDEKFLPCKCWIPCVAQKMELMDKDGKYNHDQIKSLIERLESKSWREEADTAFSLCEHENDGTFCEGGFKLLSCMIGHSQKAKRTAKKFLNLFKED